MFQISPSTSSGRSASSPSTTLVLLVLVHLTLIVCATTTTTTTTTTVTPSSTSNEIATTTRHSNRSSSSPMAHNSKTQEFSKPVNRSMIIKNMTTTGIGKSDHEGAASLLRPSFIRGLLKPHRLRPAASEQEGGEGEEEEEVTQTIMVPVSSEHESHEHQLVRGGQVIAGKSRRFRPSSESATSAHSKLLHTSGIQPSAEASLRLTSTEIGGLLNDREAPEFYRERELGGDGVVLGEESPGRAAASSSFASTDSGRLGMAASGQFGSSQFMGGGEFGPMGGGFDAAGDNAAALYRHRLAQAASEDAYGGAGFNHRFGQQAFGGGGDELGGGSFGGNSGGGGGLMQSPNEYSEVNNYGGGGFMGGQQQQQHSHFGTGASDFSPHSGLLRAGSEGAYGGGGGFGMMGGSAGLDTAAAYGGGGGGEFSAHGGSEFAGAGQSGFYGGGGAGGGRLQAHASFNPYMQSAAGEAEYASRFGQHPGGLMGGASSSPGFGLDQRGFASQNQFVSQHLQGAASSGSHSGHNKLMPFTPVVPLADELASVTQPSVLSSNQREVTAGHGSGSHHVMHQPTRAMGHQVHEAIEDDPTDVSAADESGGGSGVLGSSEHQQRQQALQQHYEGGGGGDAESQEGALATTMSSNQQDQFVRQTNGGRGEHSLVLNVPPPPDEHSQQHQMGSNSRGRAQMIEFSRVGSAGYLGPNEIPSKSNRDRHSHMLLSKKSGYQQQQQQQFDNQSDEGGDQTSVEESSEVDTPSTGADNPAHAGKYIID